MWPWSLFIQKAKKALGIGLSRDTVLPFGSSFVAPGSPFPFLGEGTVVRDLPPGTLITFDLADGGGVYVVNPDGSASSL